ncbi:hypothetical protein NM688_g3284 [Phlebia brevispora]|uniref:Uncharacterized protein n=1 Tax=Phlebia brevispora TaxID=194682 RepID=A0ACC1T620_9APHY|nr:hypothetical protein NM688_g3284 [Phlebia brevispora]
MAKNQTVAGTLSTTKKRKSTGGIDEGKTKPAKQPRRTLDTFFTPQATASNLQLDGTIVQENVTLNEEQVKVLRMVVDEEKSVFFTGAAGTGKSLLLRAIISTLRRKYSKKPELISITASTGMAASNIGGTTIHAWGAITPGMHNIDKLISYIKTCKPAHQRWKTTKVLVIDEVSMVDGHLFDTLAKLAVELRKKTDLPFGGIQLVVTGDFFQLPPVTKGKTEPFFAFQSQAWKTCIQNVISLKQVFRQSDNHFVDLLNQMRQGEITPDAKKVFISLSRPLTFNDGILPTELFPLRSEVDRANAARLTALPGSSIKYEARDSGAAPLEKRAKLLDNMVAQKLLELKIDAQVMLVKNMDETLVNGSVGKILGFYTLPVCIASAAPTPTAEMKKDGSPSSSSKPRSASQDSAGKHNSTVRHVQVGPDGRTPIAYAPPTPEEKENKDAKTPQAKGKAKAKDVELYPLVEFRTPQGKEVALIVRDEFRSEDNEGKLLARRVQIPLVLAWAMSIHKSQGQTIQRVKIDLGRVFEKGQSYVALSRAASMDGLQVLRFEARKVMAHPKVIEWSRNLEQLASSGAGHGRADTTQPAWTGGAPLTHNAPQHDPQNIWRRVGPRAADLVNAIVGHVTSPPGLINGSTPEVTVTLICLGLHKTPAAFDVPDSEAVSQARRPRNTHDIDCASPALRLSRLFCARSLSARGLVEYPISRSLPSSWSHICCPIQYGLSDADVRVTASCFVVSLRHDFSWQFAPFGTYVGAESGLSKA